MATLPLDALQKQALEALRAREAALFDRIGQSGAKAEVIRSAVPELAALSEVARALDVQGRSKTLDADGLLAVCIQHEMDHLEGKVFVEKLSRLKQSRLRARLKKQERRPVEADARRPVL